MGAWFLAAPAGVPGEQGSVPAGSFLFELRIPRHWAGSGWAVLRPRCDAHNCTIHFLPSNWRSCPCLCRCLASASPSWRF
ncbi:uncharacterized protein K444DRAFT_619975 [Hyaloscypha bicolor E]|uniref:Uncharacterized protein n=1 Tax=Hyaloscypha bicolor E TaxID=1095630 RepID=A0A2J6SP24_9HELO|nr:uncharacterized protein K444DRAFT_619975 [Hyaloscypha bicolor E]PMD52519.1 hypothetical protein K444DRAFT_619975 [Hyaloscypha bicolor E]